ncbi:MAG: TldD/PmbA family protein [Thermotogota bacterium]
MKDRIKNVLNHIKDEGFKGQINIFQSSSKKASFSNGKLDELTEGEKGNAGIKVISKDGRVANSLTNIIEEDELMKAAKKAISMAKYSEKDENNDISNDKEFTYIDWAYDEDTKGLELDDLIEITEKMEKSARAYDERIKFVRGAEHTTNLTKIIFANTNDVYKYADYTTSSASIMLAAVEGDKSSMGSDFEISQSYRLIDTDKIVKKAAEKALAGLKAKILKSGRYNIVLSPYTSAQLIGIVFSSLSGENVFKGKSFFKGKIGEKVASTKFNLIHDPMNGSAPIISSFDNEGNNTSRFHFIENGVLKNYAHNIYSANALGEKPTGNAFASSGSPIPSISPINMHALTTTTKKKIINQEKALYIENIMGLHTADPVSGRFSVQISGRIIENGEFTGSFRGMTLAGTIPELLENIDDVSSDFKYTGSISGSTMLIKNMSIGGK